MANVTKEIVNPNGAKINLNNVIIGDKTLSILEIWISEHQEQYTILINSENLLLFKKICQRENLLMSVIGSIDNSGTIVVKYDDKVIVEFNLKEILGKEMPRKIYHLEEKIPYIIKSFDHNILNHNIFDKLNFNKSLKKVLKSISVCSKQFLVNKVDRSVTGLIAQQQCCGPLQIPLSDYAVVAQSYFNLSGIVSAIGEKPIIGLLNPAAMARMSIGEMLTNIIFCKIDSINNIRCSGNWMWPIKFDGEKDRLYKACQAMCECMLDVGIALDGGKDSLSMSYQDKLRNEIIKSPGTLVISGYTSCQDIRKKVTPDFKKHGNQVYYINLSNNKYRLGCSILYQEYNQLGEDYPDFENIDLFKFIFNKIQDLVDKNIILSGHDVSDGGFITALMEMCFAGNVGFIGGIKIDVTHEKFLFAEELGIIFEISVENKEIIDKIFDKSYCYHIGTIYSNNYFEFKINDFIIINEVMKLRKWWEHTSYKMELLQTDKNCVEKEYQKYENWLSEFSFESINNYITEPDHIYHISYIKPKLAIIREEGSNGDREMAAAFYEAGFDICDITMNDFFKEDGINLLQFKGIAFVGGFSYSDVFNAARGWYQIIISNSKIKEQFDKFYKRSDTFSLGICNGCQLMALLDWIPNCELVENESQRFESRFR